MNSEKRLMQAIYSLCERDFDLPELSEREKYIRRRSFEIEEKIKCDMSRDAKTKLAYKLAEKEWERKNGQ